jgi:hypothetical protein
VRLLRGGTVLWSRLLGAGAAALLIISTGCSDDSRPSTSAQGEPSTEAPDPSNLTTEPAEALRQLPLDRFLGLESDPVRLSDAFVRYNEAVAAEMTTCMRDRGFSDYVSPVEPSPSPEEVKAADSAAVGGANLEEFGYGIGMNLEIQLSNAVTDRTVDVQEPVWLERMSSAERDAFNTESGACQQQVAAAHVHPLDIPGGIVVFEKLNSIRGAISADPAMAALWEGWSECMADRGVQASRRSDLVEGMNDAANELISKLDRLVQDAGGLLDPASPELADLRAEADRIAADERELVAHDVACATPLDLDRKARDLQFELEEQYLRDHEDELAQLVASAR